jgi:hypothetical protein
MTFTYTSDLTNDGDYVRFQTGDTTEAESILSDEIITSMISVEGSKEAAVIAGLYYKATQLARPDFKADWLSVSKQKEVAEFILNVLIPEKRRELGVSKYTASAQTVYRQDSLQTAAPDYSSDSNAIAGVEDL